MRIARQTVNRFLLTIAAVISLSALVRAQDRKEITINDTGDPAENLTSSQDGSVYFGSTAKGTIYRAAPARPKPNPGFRRPTAGLTNVLGVLADDKTSTLWVCRTTPAAAAARPWSARPPCGRST